jgi:hypothetical protein
MARNWPCSPTCALCDQAPETAKHLVLYCSFAREVWHRISLWSGSAARYRWNTSLAGLPKELRRSKAAILMYTAWNIWKARNHQVFDNLMATPAQVEEEIKWEIALRKRALGERVEVNFFHD